MQDERFPLGTGRDGSLAKSVLSLPLIQPNGEIVGESISSCP